MKARDEKMKLRRKMIEQKDQLHYKLFNFLLCSFCRKKVDFLDPRELKRIKELQKKSNGDLETFQQMDKEYMLKKLLSQRSEEQLKISKAKTMWNLIRKKIKVIRMMAKIGGDKVQQMNER